MGYLHHVKESTKKLHGYAVKLPSLQWRIPKCHWNSQMIKVNMNSDTCWCHMTWYKAGRAVKNLNHLYFSALSRRMEESLQDGTFHQSPSEWSEVRHTQGLEDLLKTKMFLFPFFLERNISLKFYFTWKVIIAFKRVKYLEINLSKEVTDVHWTGENHLCDFLSRNAKSKSNWENIRKPKLRDEP